MARTSRPLVDERPGGGGEVAQQASPLAVGEVVGVRAATLPAASQVQYRPGHASTPEDTMARLDRSTMPAGGPPGAGVDEAVAA